MKKIFLLFVAICITSKVFADYSGTCGANLTWTLTTADGVLTIKGTGPMTDYLFQLPPWYDYSDQINNVTVQNGVTSIEYAVFSGCANLTSVTIPSSVTSIGGLAFSETPWYNNQPDGLVYINHVLYTYKGTMAPNTSIVVADGTLCISDYAFSNCSGLTSVTIPNSVTNIGDYAFKGCTGLTSVIIPKAVTNIGNNAFEKTPWYNTKPNGLVYINKVLYNYKGTMPQNTSIVIADGTVCISGLAFFGQTGLISVTIPNSVKSIGLGAFYDCSGLTSVNIGSGVTHIGDYAFWGCSDLTFVIWNLKNYLDFSSPNTPFCYSDENLSDFNFDLSQQITSFTFGDSVEHIPACLCRNMIKLTSVTIPNGVMSIGDSTFYGCTGLTSVTLGNSVTSIGNGSFTDCKSLTSIIIPNSVTSIGDYAFENCSGLTSSLTIPNSVTSIKNGVFKGCTGLTSVTLGNSVTSIGNGSFTDCKGLTSIIIPNSVTSIGDYAFENCSGLTSSLTIPNSVASIKKGVFKGCTGLTSVTLGNSVTSIGDGSFTDCEGLTSIIIPNSVTSIGEGAFYGCISLPSLTIPICMTHIGNYVFGACSSLNSVVWNAKNCPDFTVGKNPFYFYDDYSIYNLSEQITSFTFGDSVEHIPSYLCAGMINLRSIVIPNSVDSIGYSAFGGCTGLTSVILGHRLKNIGNYAFCYCRGLSSSLTIPNSVTRIEHSAFEGCTGLTSVTLGSSVTNIGSYAFFNCPTTSVTSYASTPPNVNVNSFTDKTYLYVPCDYKVSYEVHPVFGIFKYIECIDSKMVTTTNEVIVTPGLNDALFTWPTSSKAASYQLEITKGEVAFCTLKFNANGQLMGITFAPSISGENNTAQYASATVSGYQFSVTGLNEASNYTYILEAKDASNNIIKLYSGIFQTEGATGIEHIEIASLYIDNGLVICHEPFKIYTISGANVTKHNGKLSSGIYIVKTEKVAQKIVVK